MLICSRTDREKAVKGVLWATVFSTLFAAMILVRNTMVLSFPLVSEFYFPSYTVASIITLGSFFQRLEVLISVVFIICKLFKLVMLLLFIEDRARGRVRLWVVTLAVLGLSLCMFSGITEAFAWLVGYRYYLILPCIAAPMVMWILG